METKVNCHKVFSKNYYAQGNKKMICSIIAGNYKGICLWLLSVLYQVQ